MADKNKVFIFGIDGMAPEFVLDKWIDELPTFKYLKNNGLFGRLESTKPPTSIAAWTSFFSGRDPGENGIYHYIEKYRKDRLIPEIITAKNVRSKRIWDILEEYNKKSILLNVIPLYPVRPINGIALSGALTPRFNENALFPYELRDEVSSICKDEYMFEVSLAGQYRELGYDDMIEGVYKMSDMQFKLTKHWLQNKDWDFFAYTLTGSDVLHHRLWRYIDEKHFKYEANSKYSNTIKDFYKYLDGRLKELIDLLDENTTIIVSSDHGMKRLQGRINLNDWLMQKGYLVLKEDYGNEVKKEVQKFDPKGIDWEKTKVFSTGAYEAMLFINKEVVGNNYDAFCNQLEEEIKEIPDKKGSKMLTRVFKAKNIYKNGYDENAPDMLVYFDDLFWGTNSDLGHENLYSWANLVGADDALHSSEGVFFMYGNKVDKRGDIGKADILDVVPTVLDLYRLEKEQDMQGNPIDYK